MEERKFFTIEQKVPRCPYCASYMWSTTYDKHVCYVCYDCNAILPVIKVGQCENELIVSDRLGDLDEEINEVVDEKRLSKSNNYFRNLYTFIRNLFQRLFFNKRSNKSIFEFPVKKEPKYFICWGGRYK